MSSIKEKVEDLVGVHNDTVNMSGFKVHSTGYGLMGLTWRKDPPPQEQSFKAMKTALDNGANLWNAGELYGTPEHNSLHLLNAYFSKYPEDAEKVVVSIKGGLVPGEMRPDGGEANTRRSIDECLRVLDGKKRLDLWEAARVDPKTPIEITMRTANEYIKSGRLGGISLSECSANSIRRAAKVVKVSAVEVEFSLWETEILENGVATTCAELGIPIVAYSPLGRGFLTGQIKSPSDIPDDDMRKTYPRFQPGTFEKNFELVREIEKLASKKNAKPSQVAIAWVKAQSKKPGMPLFIPIPGASSAERVEENLKHVDLSDEDLKQIDNIMASIEVEGHRYGGHGAALCFGDSPELNE